MFGGVFVMLWQDVVTRYTNRTALKFEAAVTPAFSCGNV